MIVMIAVLIMLLFKQCGVTESARQETERVLQNQVALNDTIKNYKTKDGLNAAEKLALRLTLDELKDSLNYERSKPPITIIEYETQIIENIVEVPVYIKSDSLSERLEITQSDKWDKSSRELMISIPFEIKNDSLYPGLANIELKQNIWLSASILQDKKTKQAYVNLLSDYPGLTFNNAQGILIEPDDKGFKGLKYNSRKTLSLGLQLGIGLSPSSLGFTPYVGVGLTYSPKFLQW